MEQERLLYNGFVEVLLEKLKQGKDISPKDLEVIQKFLASQNIGADPVKHTGLNELSTKAKSTLDLPFEEEDQLPLKRVK